MTKHLSESIDDDFIDDKEVSRITGIATTTLARWRSEKKHFDYTKFGGAVRYKRSKILSYAEKHRVEVGAA